MVRAKDSFPPRVLLEHGPPSSPVQLDLPDSGIRLQGYLRNHLHTWFLAGKLYLLVAHEQGLLPK